MDQDLNRRQSAPRWGLEGGESHVGEVFDSGLVSRYRGDAGRSSGLEDRVAGTAGGEEGSVSPHSFGSVILRGSRFLLANVCLCVEPFSIACCTQICILDSCNKNKGRREEGNNFWVE